MRYQDMSIDRVAYTNKANTVLIHGKKKPYVTRSLEDHASQGYVIERIWLDPGYNTSRGRLPVTDFKKNAAKRGDLVIQATGKNPKRFGIVKRLVVERSAGRWTQKTIFGKPSRPLPPRMHSFREVDQDASGRVTALKLRASRANGAG